MNAKVPAALAAALVLGSCAIASAAGTTSGVKVVHLNAPIEALAISGNRVAYDIQGSEGEQGVIPNRIFVWNLGTGTRTKVSGRQTRGADDFVGSGVRELAIAGTRVAWRIGSVSNEETDDDVYSSSVLAPKERHVRGVVRFGDPCGGAPGPTPACAGPWLGGVVAAGSAILVNRWTTDATGAITGGGLYALHGKNLTPFADGAAAVKADAADAHRVAVVQWRWYYPEDTINVFSADGKPLSTVTAASPPEGVALSGRNLLVLEAKGKLVLYDAQTGALKKAFMLHRGWQAAAVAVHGDVAVYSTPAASRPRSSVRALDLTTGKDMLIARLPGQIPLLRMNSVGLVYANSRYTSNGYDVRLVFRPFAAVAAAVRVQLSPA